MINTNTLIWIIIAWLMIIFFGGIEIAFANANRLTIELKKKQGINRSIILSHFLDYPSRFIGATLIGFNIFLVVFGLLVGETLSPLWEFIIKKTVIPQAWVDIIRLLLKPSSLPFSSYFFGELLPKAFFRAKSDSLLDFFATISNFFFKLLYPIAVFFRGIAEWILKYVFNVRMDERKDLYRKADLGHYFKETGESDESNQDLNTDLFEAALNLPKVKVRECLIPRKEIEGIDISVTIEEARKNSPAANSASLSFTTATSIMCSAISISWIFLRHHRHRNLFYYPFRQCLKA